MLTYRVATAADAERLFQWRNDPLTREMSRSTAPVEWEGHVAWLVSRLQRPKPDLYIVEHDGQPCGTFRIDGHEVSYTVAPEHRGKKLATAMLAMVKESFGPLDAEIYRRNIPSIKAAERAGHIVVLLD